MTSIRRIKIDNNTYELRDARGSQLYVGTCSTAAATNPKVCTVEDFPVDENGKPYVGTEIVVKFTATNTSTSTTPELNVNGTGAIRIWYNNAVLASTKSAYAGYANRYLHYVYDGTYWVFMGHSVDNNSTYTNVALGQGYAVQNNSAASATITATLGSYALTVNGIVSVKFLYDVPANATLNINGKGAKAIYNKDAAITSNVIKSGDTATFIYNTYYRLISVDRWQDKQDVISDLDTIRSGAAAGATALQSYTETDPTVPAWAKQSIKPSYTASEISGLANVATSGSYNDLSNKPTIPTSSDINAAKPLVVTLGYSNGAYTCDTSNADIYTAWSNGRDVIADADGGYIYHLCTTPTLFIAQFSGFMDELGRERYDVKTKSNVQTVTYYYDSIQQNLTFDNSPTQNSNNPVKSGGVYTAVSNVKQLVVTISWGNGGLVCDTSNADIYAAWQLGKSIICTNGEFLYQMSYEPSQSVAYFSCIEADDPYCFQVVTISTSNNTQTVTVTDAANYVPQTRKVNNKALSSNITLTASDVSAVPTTRTVNGKALSSDITLTASDIDAVPTIISTTYNDLVTARTNSLLIEGAWYRITDYVCTTAQTDTYSAGHQFDILVQAVLPNKLSEEARATRHEGDTYFAKSNLEAWKIWYCLDNDNARFSWAEPAEGKGVIYRMIDEWGNDCPYDFKNMQFKRYQLKNRNYLYASKALWDNDGNTYDNEVIANFHNTFTILYNNLNTSINTTNIPFYYTRGVHDEYYIVDESEIYGYDEIYETYRDNSGNTIALSESGTRKFVAVNDPLYDYYDIILEVNDTDGEWMYTFSRKNGINTPSIDNSLTGKIYNNKFTNSGTLYDNVFISYNIDLIVQNNSFGDRCNNNTFGNNCDSNTFGEVCYSNTFGNYVYGNTFGDSCYSNTFGNNCDSNTFGNHVYGNTFGDRCNNNSFGEVCYSNTFGNYCDSNTFGNAVNHVTFSKDYTRYVIVENGNQCITLTSTQTTSLSNLLRNITIAQGVNNTTTRKTITHTTLNDTFRTTYTVDDNGDIYAITPTKYGEWDNKQSTLVSGANIKTINNQSLLGSGNLTISDIGLDGVAFIGDDDGTSGIVDGLGQLVDISLYATKAELESKYEKPSSGIPKSDLSTEVLSSLNKADTALLPTSLSGNIKTICGNSLVGSGNVNLTAADVLALPASTSIPSKTSDLTNDSGFTSNTGTITGITMNGTSKGTSGIVNLGTVLTEHLSIKTINNNTITGTGNITISELPAVSSSDNGKVLKVNNGQWEAITPVTIYSGTSTPSNTLGVNGDIYIQTT